MIRFVTKQSQQRPIRWRLLQIIEALDLKTDGMKLSVWAGNGAPHCIQAFIKLPTVRDCGGWEQFAKSFLHEYSHARDYLDGIDSGIEDCERRARKMEKRLEELPIHLRK
jgi:hypothetical protein